MVSPLSEAALGGKETGKKNLFLEFFELLPMESPKASLVHDFFSLFFLFSNL